MRLFARFGKKVMELMNPPPPPLWNNSEELSRIWKPFEEESTEILGTALEAKKTLDECRRAFSDEQLDYWKSGVTDAEYNCLSALTEKVNPVVQYNPSHVFGHTNRVSRLATDRISLGYVIKKHPSGYTLERFEGLQSGLVVLSLSGRLIGAYPFSVMRIESGRGITWF